MLTTTEIEAHANAIRIAFEGQDFKKAAEVLYQFGALLQAEFKDSDYTRVQKSFRKIIGEDYALKEELSKNVFLGSAEMFEVISQYSMDHAEENLMRQAKGDFSLARTIPAFKLGLLCFKELVGDELFQTGLADIAEEVGQHNFSTIYECINEKVFQQQKAYLDSACEKAENLILAEICQLVQKLPGDVLKAYEDDSNKIDLAKIVYRANYGLSLLNPTQDLNMKYYAEKHTSEKYPEIHTAIKQYNIIIALRSKLKPQAGVTVEQQLMQYKEFILKNGTQGVLQASSTGKSIFSRLAHFVRAVRVSGFDAFWQEKNKKRALQEVQMIVNSDVRNNVSSPRGKG